MDKTLILDNPSIRTRLRRMAFEIYEANYGSEELYLIGIGFRGGVLASLLQDLLGEISTLRVQLLSTEVDRSTPEDGVGVNFSAELDSLKGKRLVIVDDVLYSGTTMLNVAAILLTILPTCMQIAVLIDRGHRKMPVSPDFVGMELATTLQQHVSVEVSEDKSRIEAFLL